MPECFVCRVSISINYLMLFSLNHVEQVTCWGQSAGAGSVVMLSVIPEANGLFQRAIAESASDGRPIKNYIYLDDVLNATKCPDPPCTISFLKDLPTDELMNVTASFSFLPYFDPAVLPTISSILYSEGAINPTDMIVGSNTFDDVIVVGSSPSDYIAMAEGGIENHIYGFDLFNITTPDERQAAIDAYLWDKFNGSSVLASAQYSGDAVYTCPLRDIAVSAATSRYDGKMFVYHFGHLSKYDAASQKGLVTAANITDPKFTAHGGELPFVFGNAVGVDDDTKIPFSDKEKILSREMMSRWASFARSGNPNLSNDEPANEWFPVSSSNAPGIMAADPRYMRFTIDGGTMVESDKDKMEKCAAIFLDNPLFDHIPTNAPTDTPTAAPIVTLSAAPSKNPTKAPTTTPNKTLTSNPAQVPTDKPSKKKKFTKSKKIKSRKSKSSKS